MPNRANRSDRRLLGLLLVLLLAAPAAAAVLEVEIELPIRPKLKLTGQETLVLAPFLVGSRSPDEEKDTELDLDRELRRYLQKQLERKTRLTIRPMVEGIRLPSADPEILRDEAAFWVELAEANEADIVVAGLIDFEVQDRSGFRREEYVSPIDGRTYYRQIMIEETGFDIDIALWAIDGRNGEILHEEKLKTFRRQAGRQRDELKGLFDNLFQLETRMLAVFVSREIEAKRYIFK